MKTTISLQVEPFEDRGGAKSNFFFLSSLTPRELLSSILKPNSSKTSLPSSFFDTPRDSKSDADSQRNMSSGTPQEPRASTATATASPESFNNAAQVEEGGLTEGQWKPEKKEWHVMVTLAISSLTVALDATILVPVLPTLAVSLHGSANEAFWAGTAYLLASAVVQPLIAALSDIFGRRELLVPSLLFFAVSSVICGVAKSFTTLLVGRVIQGIGGGGIITLTQIIYADIIPLRQRPRYFSLVLAAWAVGTLLGPIIGAAFVERASWRWCFYLNLPICGVALPMALLFVKLHTEKKTIMQKLGMVDWAGGFVFITSLTAALVAISSGGVDHPWSSWRVLVPLLIGIIGTILSLAYERYTATNPFFQRSLFPNLSALATHISALFQGAILFMTLYYVSFYFSAAKLASPLNAAAKLLAVAALVLPGSIIVSALITRLGTYRWAIWIGWTVTTLGCGLLILLDEHTSSAVYSSALAILGLGLGMILSSVNFATQASVVDTADSGRAAAMYAFMRTLGMTLGVALGGTIFQNLMKQKLRHLGLPEAIAMDAEAYVQILRNMPVDDPTRAGVLKAYASGFRGIFVTETIIAAVALMGTGLVRHFSMDRILDSKYRIEKGTEKTSRME